MATEKRLIYADNLKSAMYLICHLCQTENIFIDAIIDEIDNADDVDAVEVVRCKDCKWLESGKDYEAYCNHWKSGLYASVKDNDYCSYGERKQDG